MLENFLNCVLKILGALVKLTWVQEDKYKYILWKYLNKKQCFMFYLNKNLIRSEDLEMSKTLFSSRISSNKVLLYVLLSRSGASKKWKICSKVVQIRYILLKPTKKNFLSCYQNWRNRICK